MRMRLAGEWVSIANGHSMPFAYPGSSVPISLYARDARVNDDR